MESDFTIPLVRLSLAMFAGALIGLERTYHGRPAGFRTHILVCTASTLLMMLTIFQLELIPNIPLEVLRSDPTRMAQGIMTGIGFLGAGVIVREGLTVRGLTTAASIWITAAIGIMIGTGLLFAAMVAEVMTIVALSLLGLLESKLPTYQYARIRVRFMPDIITSESELKGLIISHGLTCSHASYFQENHMLQYEMTIRTRNLDNYRKLAETLAHMENVHDFSIVPTLT
jgi:putative Mg2+ transporter-C (MgtC) family protein